MAREVAQAAAGGGPAVAQEDQPVDPVADMAGVGAAPEEEGDGRRWMDPTGERRLTGDPADPTDDPAEDTAPDGTLADDITPVADLTPDEFMATLPDDVLITPIGEVFEETDD